jgi:hypothetical protein
MRQFLLNLGRGLKMAALRAAGWLFRHMPGTPWELTPGPLTYNQDGLATIINCDFLNDPRFQEAYRLGEQTGSWKGARIHWRVHVLCWAADKASRLEDDFVECGVNRGGFSRAVIDFVDFPRLGKTFYLLDTFRGLEDKLVPGAVMVLDDYGWEAHYEQEVGFDRFAAQKGVMILALPTGQGLILKP